MNSGLPAGRMHPFVTQIHRAEDLSFQRASKFHSHELKCLNVSPRWLWIFLSLDHLLKPGRLEEKKKKRSLNETVK